MYRQKPPQMGDQPFHNNNIKTLNDKLYIYI